jgi:hypothetical protein
VNIVHRAGFGCVALLLLASAEQRHQAKIIILRPARHGQRVPVIVAGNT